MTRSYVLTDEQANTVHAILMTHAEMQDARSVESMELLSRLSKECPDEGEEMIDTLQEQIDDFDDDCDDLRAIADIFVIE